MELHLFEVSTLCSRIKLSIFKLLGRNKANSVQMRQQQLEYIVYMQIVVANNDLQRA